MVNEINRGALNEIRRGVEMPLRGAQGATKTCECGRTFSTAQRFHECACGITWVSQQAYDRSMQARQAKEMRTVTTTTTAAKKPYTMTEARAQAEAERDACWSVIERKAAELQGPRKLTKAAAITAVLSEDRGLYHRYNELQNVDRQAEATYRAMSEDTAWQETEAIRVERDKAKADDYKPVSAIDKKIHEAALAIMEKHGITYDSARSHALERNPEWRVEWANESPLFAQPSTMVYSETLNDLDAEIGTAAVLYQRAHPGTTYAVAYTEAMQASVDFRRRYVELSHNTKTGAHR